MNALITLNDNYDATGTLAIEFYRADGSNSSKENKTDEVLMKGYFREILERMLEGYTFREAVHALPQNRPLWLDDASIRLAFYEEYEFFDALKNPAIVKEYGT